MSVFPKFIIETDAEEGDCLIIAKCTYHKQLATDKTKVKGGGWFSVDLEKKVFTLHGQSEDFGRATIEDISDCIKRGKAFYTPSLVRSYTDEFIFKYRDESGETFDLPLTSDNQ